jgi:hypothetical protein
LQTLLLKKAAKYQVFAVDNLLPSRMFCSTDYIESFYSVSPSNRKKGKPAGIHLLNTEST